MTVRTERQTRLAVFENSDDASYLALQLRTRLLPRRGYQSIYADGGEVFVVHTTPHPSWEFNTIAQSFIAGYKAALSVSPI